jgi:DNA-binding response OmpR family regulator
MIIQSIHNKITERDFKDKIRFYIKKSHDILALISLIKKPLNELETQEELSHQGKKSLTAAMDNTNKLLVLITQLLDFQKTDMPKYRRTHIRASDKNVLLLAEDNNDMREYLTESLSIEYQVISVTDGAQLLDMAIELNPDIIISDILMPVLRGDEVCRILKSSIETSHIPFILLSALREKENVILGMEAGANDYITKPFEFAILNDRIRNILKNRNQLREMALTTKLNLEDMNYVNQLDKNFLNKAIQIIEKELGEPGFSINKFCQELAMSRTSVYNKMKTLTGQAPNDFIRIIRLNKSRELLKSKIYTIAEVSERVGFSDPKYFSTSFKKQFGVSPSKF